MPVNFVRPELRKMLKDKYNLISDCIEGRPAMVRNAKNYIFHPEREKDADAYERYVKRAVFYNMVARTIAGFVGLVGSKPTAIDIPPELEILKVDMNGSGVGLDQSARKAIGFGMGFGRAGLLTSLVGVDSTEIVTTKDVKSGKARPTISLIDPKKIINWKEMSEGSEVFLWLVVIEETYSKDVDEFSSTEATRYRVLRLGQPLTEELKELGDFIYHVQLWEDVASDVPTVEYVPFAPDGKPLTRIPFDFIGSENNDSIIDAPPMYDICVLAAGHFANSAEFEESCFMLSQGTPWTSGVSEEWAKNVMGGGLTLGANVIPLPIGAAAGMLEVGENNLAMVAMEHKEAQAVALGAKLVEVSKVQRTVDEVNMMSTSETSILRTVVDNVSAAYRRQLEYCAMLIGSSYKIEFALNSDFDISGMNAEERKSIISNWLDMAISFTEMRDALRKGGVELKEDEIAKAEIKKDFDNSLSVSNGE